MADPNKPAPPAPDHDDAAETALLGAMLLSPQAVATVLPILTNPDQQLYRPHHATIYHAITNAPEWGDQLLVLQTLTRTGLTRTPDGRDIANYLNDCTRACPLPAHAAYYAHEIARHAATRTRTTHATQLLHAAHNPHRWDQLAQNTPTLTSATTGPTSPPGLPTHIPTLKTLLDHPDPPLTWRIEGWQPTGSRVILAAAYKSGKSTLVGNTLRSLADGQPFLGHYPVHPPERNTTLIDLEMSPRQLRAWLADQHITNTERIHILALRGQAQLLDLTNPDLLHQWATYLHDHHTDYLILDCLRPLLDALGLNEHTDAGRILVPLDTLLTQAGISDALLIHHMGHAGERSRGDSRLRDWPDVEWRLVREDPDEPASRRYLTGYGRDVDQPEHQLTHDIDTRHVTGRSVTRRDHQIEAALDDIYDLLTSRGTLSGNRIETDLMRETQHPRANIRKALQKGVERGWILAEPGPRRATNYRTLERDKP